MLKTKRARTPHVLLLALLGLSVSLPAIAQGEAERSVDLLVEKLVANLKRGSKVVVRPFASAHTGLPDSVADRIETLILGALRTRIQRDMEVTLVTGNDVLEIYESLEESAFGGDQERLLESVLRSARADAVLACMPFGVGDGPSHFEIRCRATFARLVCPGGGDVESCPNVEVEDIGNQGGGTARIPYRSEREYLEHVFSHLAWELASGASLGGKHDFEVMPEDDDSKRNADLETFVSTFLHEKIGQASEERLGRRTIEADGGRRLQLVWSVVPFGESYRLAVTLRGEGVEVPVPRNAWIAVSVIPANLRLLDDEIEDEIEDTNEDETSPLGGQAILVVETEPSGASVVVGGEGVGETPLTRVDLRAGTWSVVVDHPWYETIRLEEQVLEEFVVLRIDRRLIRASGRATVLLEAPVSGAWVDHGGKRREVPVSLDGLPVGPVILTLGAPGHHDLRVEVEVPKEGVAMVRRRLEPVRHGTLTVTAVPSDARVEVEGAGSYRSGMRLPLGSYRVRVSREGYLASESEVEVSGESSLRVVLERESHAFTVVTEPREAEVRLLDVGERYRPGMELPPGTYRVRVSAIGWEAHVATVEHGRSATRHVVRLERLPPPPAEVESGLGLTYEERVLVQHGLASLGEDVDRADGVFGLRTRAGLRSYQKSKGLAETGYLTAELSEALQALGREARRLEEGRRQEELARREAREAGERASDDASFARAKRLNTVAGYEEYLARGGRHESEVRVLLAEVAKPRWEVGEEFRDCSDCPELVVVPGGSYEMGSPLGEEGRYDDEGPLHRVRISERFAVGVYEVTFREWDACRRAGGCSHDPDDRGWGRGERPVIDVSWEDARAYVRWLSGETGKEYRLLSESEWEYVARGGTTGPFHFGLTISPEQANYNGDYAYGSGGKGRYRKRTELVGSFPSNAFGLHDVHGNVWEWVEDCWHGSYQGAPSDGSAWTSGGDCGRRVLRGGSWNNEPRYLRSANRIQARRRFPELHVGFRVARTLD